MRLCAVAERSQIMVRADRGRVHGARHPQVSLVPGGLPDRARRRQRRRCAPHVATTGRARAGAVQRRDALSGRLRPGSGSGSRSTFAVADQQAHAAQINRALDHIDAHLRPHLNAMNQAGGAIGVAAFGTIFFGTLAAGASSGTLRTCVPSRDHPYAGSLDGSARCRVRRRRLSQTVGLKDRGSPQRPLGHARPQRTTFASGLLMVRGELGPVPARRVREWIEPG